MFKTILTTFVVTILATTANHTIAQDVNAMNAAFNQQLNAQMQAASHNMVQTNMRDPYIQQQYQIYRQQGGQLNFPSYCFRYGETGGYTPEGTWRAINTSNQIHQQDMKNYGDYVEHSRRVKQQTYDDRNGTQDKWAHQRGENLTAQSTYVNGTDGSSWQLPNNASPGQMFYDNRTGTYFTMNGQGQYFMNNGQGWQSMHYQQ